MRHVRSGRITVPQSIQELPPRQKLASACSRSTTVSRSMARDIKLKASARALASADVTHWPVLEV
jgi:hypothetical protein